MKLVIRDFIAKNGERFSHIYDSSALGFPLFYPTAYTTRVLRQDKAHNTQKVYLIAIKKLYEWAHSTDVDLHTVLLEQKFLPPHQIDTLAAFLQNNAKLNDGSVISGGKYNNYLDAVTDYLVWYASEIITDSNSSKASGFIERMSQAIKARKTKVGSQTRKDQERLEKKLPTEAQEALMALFDKPLEGVSKTGDQGPRFRNVVALRILYDTGMRIGELLSLRYSDFEIAAGGESAYLRIVRRHDDFSDDRIIQPVAKTLSRKVPVEKQLEAQISEYLKWREQVPGVGFDDDSPLLVIHQGRERQGHGITPQGFHSSITNMVKKFPALTGIHPHLLRHDWNYRFSKKCEAEGVTEIDEQNTREFLMGWVEGSVMSSLYNRRHIQEAAFELGLKIASDTSKKQ